MTAPQTENTATGHTMISTKAVTKIVAAAVKSVPGTAQLDSAFSRSYPRIDVQVDDECDTMSADIIIAATWPSPVVTVAETVRATVDAWVREMTGIRPVRINVVVGPVEPGVAVSEQQLQAHDIHPRPRPVTVTPLEVSEVVVSRALSDVLPVTVDRKDTIRAVSRGAAPEVYSPVRAQPRQLVSTVAPKALSVRNVDVTPNRFHDKPVTVAPAAQLRRVAVFPATSHPGPVPAVVPQPLKAITAQRPEILAHPRPEPRPTIPVTIAEPVPTITPRVLPAAPLTPVGVASRPLKQVTIARRNLRRVHTPRPITPTPVTVRSKMTTLKTPRVTPRTIIIPQAPRARAAAVSKQGRTIIDHDASESRRQS
ncbi:Asp23/Gls24 family envelope stress response protein [Corynebacterium aquilae]|uniref:Asp23/Gls24 family envelope stress response protein n=1 Tax=Corynebacterium aquilae TaxID=203263 RepID=UPI000953354A|nr:Asp23/Gls24 family envelope stress response protein [Corynebacterium aquilae]